MQTSNVSPYLQIPGHTFTLSKLTNRQRIAWYDMLIDRAQLRADNTGNRLSRRRYLTLILRLQSRALRELGRSH